MDRLHCLDDSQFYLDASSDQERFLIAQFHLQQQLKRVFSLVFLLAMAELDAINPTFLTLPAQLKALEQDHHYYLACLQGRLFYRSDQYQYDEELDHAIYKPVQYTRAMIYDHITYVIHLPGDPRFAATVPLALWSLCLAKGRRLGSHGPTLDDCSATSVVQGTSPCSLLSFGRVSEEIGGALMGVFMCPECSQIMTGTCSSCGAWYCDDCYNWHCDPSLFPPSTCTLVRTTGLFSLSQSGRSRPALQLALACVNEKGPCSTFRYQSTYPAEMPRTGPNLQFWTCKHAYDDMTGRECLISPNLSGTSRLTCLVR